MEFHVEVQELNDSGEYVPVEVQPRTNVGTGGIFQLRQGISPHTCNTALTNVINWIINMNVASNKGKRYY